MKKFRHFCINRDTRFHYNTGSLSSSHPLLDHRWIISRLNSLLLLDSLAFMLYRISFTNTPLSRRTLSSSEGKAPPGGVENDAYVAYRVVFHKVCVTICTVNGRAKSYQHLSGEPITSILKVKWTLPPQWRLPLLNPLSRNLTLSEHVSVAPA